MGKRREKYRAKYHGEQPVGLLGSRPVYEMQGVRVRVVDGPRKQRETSVLELKRWANDPESLVITISPLRPLGDAFVRTLELRYFPPVSALNNKFDLAFLYWQDLAWIVVRIPATCRHLAEKVAAELDLRLADGVPHVVEGDRLWGFPLSTPQVWDLQGSAGSPVYEPGGEQDERNRERAFIYGEEEAYEREHGATTFYAVKPLVRNVPVGGPGWVRSTCAECGVECWWTPNIDLFRQSYPKNTIVEVCTECSLKKGGREWTP